MKKRSLAIWLLLAAIVAVLLVFVRPKHSGSDGQNGTTKHSTSQSGSQHDKLAFDKHQHSLSDPASLWIIVNKQRPLDPKTYAPSDLVTPDIPLRLGSDNDEMHLRKDAAAALKTMADAAQSEAGLKLMLASGYRSYNFQVGLYNRYVQQQGQAVADTQSARPGYSEHQTGLAADLEPASRSCEVEDCFASTPEGKWVVANAYRFGFVIRYTEGNQSTTGYIYEPWHVRYVGNDLAKEVHDTGSTTLEDFFGLGKATDY